MLDVMSEAKEKVDMLSMITEHKNKRITARTKAIEALEGFIDGDVDQDEYDMAVAEYADTLVDIHTTEANHLAYKGEEDEGSSDTEL